MKVYTKAASIQGSVMNATLTSTPFQIKYIWGVSIQLTYTGTPTGTFTIQASCDPVNDQIPENSRSLPTHWTTITSTSQAVAAAGSFIYNLPEISYNWLRIVYTDGSSGASTAVLSQATVNTKGV